MGKLLAFDVPMRRSCQSANHRSGVAGAFALSIAARSSITRSSLSVSFKQSPRPLKRAKRFALSRHLNAICRGAAIWFGPISNPKSPSIWIGMGIAMWVPFP